MANGFSADKILSEVRRDPRNLLEFADITPRPRQVTTAELITNTLDSAFERAGETYIQAQQINAGIEGKQIEAGLQRERLDLENKRFQTTEDRKTDNILFESIKDVDIKTQAGVETVQRIIGEISDPRFSRVLGDQLSTAKVDAQKYNAYEQIFQGKDISEILTGNFVLNGEEKSGKAILDEYIGMKATGAGIFGVGKDASAVEKFTKYRNNADYYDYAYGKYNITDKKGAVTKIDNLSRFGFDSQEINAVRALMPKDGSALIKKKLTEKGLTQQQLGMMTQLQNAIRNEIAERRGYQDSLNNKATDLKSEFGKNMIRLRNESTEKINNYQSSLDALLKGAGITIPTGTPKPPPAVKDPIIIDPNIMKIDIKSGKYPSFKPQDIPRLITDPEQLKLITDVATIKDGQLVQDKKLLDALTTVGFFDKFKGENIVDVQPIISDTTTTTEADTLIDPVLTDLNQGGAASVGDITTPIIQTVDATRGTTDLAQIEPALLDTVTDKKIYTEPIPTEQQQIDERAGIWRSEPTEDIPVAKEEEVIQPDLFPEAQMSTDGTLLPSVSQTPELGKVPPTPEEFEELKIYDAGGKLVTYDVPLSDFRKSLSGMVGRLKKLHKEKYQSGYTGLKRKQFLLEQRQIVKDLRSIYSNIMSLGDTFQSKKVDVKGSRERSSDGYKKIANQVIKIPRYILDEI